MKQLKSYTIAGIIFVIILGTFSHFFYEWSNNNSFVGFFSPVSESVWEHMKLIFFPMLLYSLIVIPKLKSDYPCIASAFSAGILLGTLLVPVLFYTYTGILGYNLLVLDITVFAFCTVLAFITVYRLASSCKTKSCAAILYAMICLMFISFIVFSYHPPH